MFNFVMKARSLYFLDYSIPEYAIMLEIYWKFSPSRFCVGVITIR